MAQAYYQHIRAEIASLLPATAERIVDIGCGSGATLAWLRRRYTEAHTIGLEGNPDLQPELERNAHEAHIVDLNGEVPDLGAPDVMLFLDVLEHLPEPATALARLASQLAPNGMVIVSVPNVAHLSVAAPLLLRGEFTYADAGILDRTHLRFFDAKSSVRLIEAAGLAVDRALLCGISGPKTVFANLITLQTLRFRLATQFLLRGRHRHGEKPIAPVRWELADYSLPEELRHDTPR